MQWFAEKGIQPGEPESIQRNLETEGREKLFGSFKLQAPPVLRKNSSFSIKLIKIEDCVENEESINPE
jgi:hypothetical protein